PLVEESGLGVEQVDLQSPRQAEHVQSADQGRVRVVYRFQLDPVSHERAGADVDVAVQREDTRLDARVSANRALPAAYERVGDIENVAAKAVREEIVAVQLRRALQGVVGERRQHEPEVDLDQLPEGLDGHEGVLDVQARGVLVGRHRVRKVQLEQVRV